MDKQNILVIDVGSFQIKAYAAQADENETLLTDSQLLKSEGVAYGTVSDSDALAEVLRQIKTKLAPLDDYKIVIGVSGMGLTTRFALGALPLSDGTVDEIDLQQVAATSALTTQLTDSEVLHIVPKNYRLDGVYDDAPLKRHGRLLECECSAVAIDKEKLSLLKKSLLKAGLEPDYIVANLFMIYNLINERIGDSAYILLNVGSDNTEAALCEDNKLIRVYSIPCGGRQITEALSRELSIDFWYAERLKRYFAMWDKQEFYGQGKIIDCSYENSEDNNVQYDRIYDIIDSETHKIMQSIQEKIGIDLIDRNIKKVYYTGGCSLLYNVPENIKTVFDLEAVQITIPEVKMEFVHPDHIAGYGAAVYIGKKFMQMSKRKFDDADGRKHGGKPSILTKIKRLFKL